MVLYVVQILPLFILDLVSVSVKLALSTDPASLRKSFCARIVDVANTGAADEVHVEYP